MGYHGNDNDKTTSMERNQVGVAKFGCFETDPFESHLSPSSSPSGKYDDKSDSKWRYLENTLSFNDNTPVEDALETQLVNLAGETEPLDNIDCVEDMSTQLLDQIGEGVAFDSDGEGTDRTEVLENVDELSADDAHYSCSAQSADSKENPFEPCCGHGKKKLSVQTDAIVDEQTSAGPMPPQFTFLHEESLRDSALAAHNLTLKKPKVETNSVFIMSQSREPVAVKHGKPGGSEKVSEVDQEYDQGKWTGQVEGLMNQNRFKVAHSAVRKLFNDELPAERTEPSLRSNGVNEGEDLAKFPIYDGELAGLSYVDSQEPGELSQANALEFIDRYVEENIMEFDQEANHVKNVLKKSKYVPSTQGQQSLAKRANYRGKAGKSGVYDWDDNREDERGGDTFFRRKEEFLGGKSFKRKSLHGVSKIIASRPNDYEDGEEKLSISNKRTSASHSGSRPLLQNLKVKDNTVQETATKSGRNLVNDLDKQLNINSSRGELEPNATAVDAQEMLGVGLDTQMAAEGMEALCNGEGIVNKDANDATHVTRSSLGDPPNSSSVAKITAITSKECSIQYARKRKFNVKLDLQTSNSSKRYMKEAKQLCKRGNLLTRSKRSKLNAEDNPTSIASENGSDLPSHIIEQKLARDSKIHQVAGLNNCTGSVRRSGMRLIGRRHLQGGLCAFTPVAYRTRQSLGKDQLVKPDRPSRSFREEDRGVGSLEKRNSGTSIQGSKAFGPKSTIECSDPFGVDENTKLCQLEKSASKFSKVNNGIIMDTLEYPKRRRSLRKLCHDKGSEKLSATSKPSAQSEDIGESNAKRKTRTEATSVAESNMNGQTQSSSYIASMMSSIDQQEGKMSDQILDKVNPGDTAICCNVVDKDPYLNSGGKNETDFLLSAKSFEDTGLDELLRERYKSFDLAPSTPANFKTTVNDASPVFMGDNYHEQSCNGNISKLPLVKVYRRELHRELRSLSATGLETTTPSKDLRKRRDMTHVRILFSHHLDEDIIKHQKKILVRLGASVASSISDATHFIADEFVRTRNMLEAIASGKLVVTHLWIESCGQACCFIDEKNYILRDAKKEKEFGFCMPVSLALASQYPLLEGRRVLITPNAKPSKEIISCLVKAVQGQVSLKLGVSPCFIDTNRHVSPGEKAVERIGRSSLKDDKTPDDLLVLSCEEDYASCVPFLKKGAAIYSSELLLNGIVIQKLEYERHQLFGDHVKKTQSTLWLKRASFP